MMWAQDIGSRHAVSGHHQQLSAFWLPHLQRAARAELALSMHAAAQRAQREANASWHKHMARARSLLRQCLLSWAACLPCISPEVFIMTPQ
jgi:hypothetical protein